MVKRVYIILTVLVMGLALAPAASFGQKKASKPTVTIENSRYSPAKLSIKTGETVVWNNEDDRDHTVVASKGSFASGNIKPGKSFSHTFKKPGTYPYGCRLHPRMKGTVIVE